MKLNPQPMMKKLAILGSVAALAWAGSSQANVEHRGRWKPTYTTEVMQAPAPPNVDQRAREFAERNSPEQIEALAREFFELVDLRQVREVQRLYMSGEFQAALDAYRDFFIERLRKKKFPMGMGSILPRHPDERIFVEFLHDLDELLNNVLTLAMVEGEDTAWNSRNKWVTVKWRLGDSGRINWIAVPEGFNTGERHINGGQRFTAHILSTPHVLNVLLSAYLKTQDARYLHKWCELNDERYMRLRGDAWAAGMQSRRSANETEYYTRGTLSHLAWLAGHDLWPSGGHPNWSPLRSMANNFTGNDPRLLHTVPEALTDPENARIISAVFNQGNGAHAVTGVPDFTSDAHPYAGFYYIRSGWGENDQHLYLQSTRPMSSATWQNNNNILLRAFGRDLFIFGRNTPVFVDGCSQIDDYRYDAYPPEYRARRFEPLYGKAHSEIVVNNDDFSIRTQAPDGVNLSIYQFSATPGRKVNELAGAGAQQMISVLYPRPTQDARGSLAA